MEVHVTRNTSVPISHAKSVQVNRSVADAGIEIPQSTRNGARPAAVHGMSYLELAEINNKKATIGEEQLMRAIERALKEMIGPNTSLEVRIHEQTNSVVMRVRNQDTGELIREIPPERTLDIVYKMMEIAGILFDERV